MKKIWMIVFFPLILVFGGLSGAASYPQKTVTLVVPYAAGGGTDILARIIAYVAPKYLGQKMVVEIRAGSGGAIGANFIAHASPDGYNLLLGAPGCNSIMPQMQNVGYTGKDFLPVAKIAKDVIMLVVKSDSPYKSFDDFLAAAKKGDVNYGSAGPGSGIHLATAAAFSKAGVKITYVPYKGGGPALTALLGGHIQSQADHPQVFLPHIKAGTLRPLVVYEPSRDPAFPDVPTLKEKGIPVAVAAWKAVFAPARTPKPVIDKLRSVMKSLAEDPGFIEQMNKTGNTISYLDGPDFQKEYDSEYQQYGETIKQLDLK